MQNIHISYGGSSHVRCYLFLSVTSFSVIATLFDVVSCIFKLKDFSCSNSVMLHSFIKLGLQSPFWKSCCDAYQKIILLDNFIIMLGLLTHFNFVIAFSHYIALPIPPTLYCFFIPTLMFFLYSLFQMIDI